MKNYTLTRGNEVVSFKVDEDWLKRVRINATDPLEEQIYNAALTDPEFSGIVTDDDKLNESIEQMKELVKKAKEINKEKNSDIRIFIEKAGTYAVKFAGQIYCSNMDIKETSHAIDKIKAYLDHNNLVKVRIFTGEGKTELQRAMDLEAWIANNCHRVISIADNGDQYTLVYIAKGYAANSRFGVDNDDEDFDD